MTARDRFFPEILENLYQQIGRWFEKLQVISFVLMDAPKKIKNLNFCYILGPIPGWKMNFLLLSSCRNWGWKWEFWASKLIRSEIFQKIKLLTKKYHLESEKKLIIADQSWVSAV